MLKGMPWAIHQSSVPFPISCDFPGYLANIIAVDIGSGGKKSEE